MPSIDLGGPYYGSCTRALSIDGGGIRGIIPALILAEIERRTGKPIAKQFGLIVGTSTGAILALGLARPAENNARVPQFSASELVDFFKKDGVKVFRSPHSPLRRLRQLVNPKYDDTGINSILDKYFGDVRMSEALVTVLIPAYDIEDLNQIWFSSMDGIGSGGDLYMKDVLRGATAAPSYFPPARFSVPRNISDKGYVSLVDGGIFANDPGLKMLEISGLTSTPYANKQSVLLLSLGTGGNRKKYTFEEAWKWGAVEWLNPLLEMLFSDSAVEKRMRRATDGPGINYVRLQADLEDSDLTLDDSDPRAIESLVEASERLLKLHKDEIDSVVADLSLPKPPQCDGSRPGPGLDREPVPPGPRIHRH